MLKLYKTDKSASAAVRGQGLQLVKHEIKYICAAKSGYYVEFTVDNMEDYDEIQSRGFKSVLVK